MPRSRPASLWTVGALAALAASCNGAGTTVGSGAKAGTVDLGGGVVATLGGDGSFTLASGGKTLVSTLPGTPLFIRTRDPDQPDAWHDPTKAHPDLATAPVDLSTVTADGGADGSGTRALHLVVPEQPADTALLSLTLAADDGFVTGLGEQEDRVSARGRMTPMFLTIGGPLESGTNEAHVPVPFLVSSRGWGLFVASREAGAFDVGATDAGTVRVTFEGRSLDVWFFADPDPLAIVARFNRIAGLPRPLPRWALSPIHWRHWASADDVLSIAAEYRKRHIPSSALWLDDGWQTGLNTFRISPSVFGDAQPMMQQLAALGFRVLAWSTPYLEQAHGTPTDEAQQLYVQAAANHWFVEDGHGSVYVSPATPIKGGAGIVDFTNAGARSFWETLVGRAAASGIRGFKCDYGEELIPNLIAARNPVLFSDGTTARTARLYPIEEHAAYHAALDAAFPMDGVIIARASSWGGASQADVIWPGDLDSSFARHGDMLPSGQLAVGGLPAVVVDAQTLSVSGFPAFGSDTAGYRGSPTPEVIRRWMEHTALSVVMQVYEDGARLPWAIDDGGATAAEYAQMATLHQQLEPYQAIQMREAAVTGTPPIRPLPLAFPDDASSRAHADDEYLLGPDLLVAPVLVAGATTWSVHLPPGRWVHWWSDRLYDGPADVTVPAPLGQPPLFARAGGLVPMLPGDIDTLGDATAPGVVTFASRGAELQARAWASGPGAPLRLDDGASLAVDDEATGVTVSWSPGAFSQNLTIDVDVRARTGGAAPPTGVTTLSGAPLAAAPGPSAVQAEGAPSWAIAGGHAWLRFVGAGSARIR